MTGPSRPLSDERITERLIATVATQTLLEDQVTYGVDSDVETSDINDAVDCKTSS